MQAVQLREFNRRGDPEAVIRAFEGGAAVSSEETLGEYVKALVAVDRLDSSSLLQTLQVPPRKPDIQQSVPCLRWVTLLHRRMAVPPGTGPATCVITAVVTETAAAAF